MKPYPILDRIWSDKEFQGIDQNWKIETRYIPYPVGIYTVVYHCTYSVPGLITVQYCCTYIIIPEVRPPRRRGSRRALGFHTLAGPIRHSPLQLGIGLPWSIGMNDPMGAINSKNTYVLVWSTR